MPDTRGHFEAGFEHGVAFGHTAWIVFCELTMLASGQRRYLAAFQENSNGDPSRHEFAAGRSFKLGSSGEFHCSDRRTELTRMYFV